jgi:NitT/TauT family transport system permease protein
LPYVLAGFRLAAGRALIAAVVAEYLIGIEGLGFYVLLNARSFRHDEAFVAVIALALFGIATLFLVRWATRRLCPWYQQSSG